MYVSFKKSYEYRDALTGRKRTVPVGWSGELPDEVVAAAVSGGFAETPAGAPAPKKAASPKKEGAAG